jgi:hypothetical protein
MPVFVLRNGRMVDKETGEPMVPPDQPFRPVTPLHVSDIAPYLSPVDGRYISGRRAKRADLDRHNCVDASDLPSPTGGKLKNRKFAEKRGLTHLLHEDAR